MRIAIFGAGGVGGYFGGRLAQAGEEIVDKAMAVLDNVPASGTSSLQRDIIAGKPSELDAWTGAVVRFGQEVGVATPLHSFITA